jgi:hypothetical protein
VSTQRSTIQEARARSDGLRLLKAINDTQAHGEEGARADPSRAAHEAGLEVGSLGYEDAHAYLIEQGALLWERRTCSSATMLELYTLTDTPPTSSPGGRRCCWRDEGPRRRYSPECVE